MMHLLQRAAGDRWKALGPIAMYPLRRQRSHDEARRRGNSTYLVTRHPICPEALSNELCSLKPNVTVWTKCVEFDGERWTSPSKPVLSR